jgi:hypothetical protein
MGRVRWVRRLPAAVALILFALPPGSQASLVNVADAFSAQTKVVGSLSYGQTSATVLYTSHPKYRAFKFAGRKGDKVETWVRSSDGGDAVAWIVDPHFAILGKNDDADSSTSDAHIAVTLPDTANRYFVVFRDHDFRTSNIRVQLLGAAAGKASVTANLLENGNAELGPAVINDSTVVRSIPGWVRTGDFTAVRYGSPGGFPGTLISKQVRGGKNFFAGGPSNPGSGASQVVSVAKEATQFGAGRLSATLAGDLGGFSSQRDSLAVTATFLGASGEQLGVIRLEPVTPAERKGETTLLARSATTALPAGTRSIQVTLRAVRTDGAYNDGYADNLRLFLSRR